MTLAAERGRPLFENRSTFVTILWRKTQYENIEWRLASLWTKSQKCGSLEEFLQSAISMLRFGHFRCPVHLWQQQNFPSQFPSTTVSPSSQRPSIIMCMSLSVCKNTALTCRFHSTQATQLCVRHCWSRTAILYAGIPQNVMCGTGECLAVSRCSHHPQVLLVCHSDGEREPPLSETLLFYSVGALRSLPR